MFYSILVYNYSFVCSSKAYLLTQIWIRIEMVCICIKWSVSASKWSVSQSWALALYFQVRSALSAHFISMDRYRSSAHLANFQVCSSLYRSQKNQWFALGKER